MSKIQRSIEDFLTGIGYTGEASAVTQVVIEPRIITVQFLKKNNEGDYYWDDETQKVAGDAYVIRYDWDE